MNIEEYKKIVKKHSVKENKTKNVLISFIIGGFIGLFSEAFARLLENHLNLNTNESTMYTTILLIVIGSICTGLGFFDNLVSYAKSGLMVPTTGFSHAMTSSAMDHNKEGLIKGMGSNIFKLTGSVILYGIVASFFLALIKGVLS